MGKLEIRPLATPKPLNRSSQNVAHVIISWLSTHTQNLILILKGFLFPVCAKLRIKDVYSASRRSASTFWISVLGHDNFKQSIGQITLQQLPHKGEGEAEAEAEAEGELATDRNFVNFF